MIRFMDGTPVPADYLARLGALIDGACADDPGEANEPTTTDPLADLIARRRAAGAGAWRVRLTDLEARIIAANWHGGGGTALYAFASTGAIDTARKDHDIAAELTDCARAQMGKGGPDLTNLIDLRTYCRRHGPRGPVAGWSDLVW